MIRSIKTLLKVYTTGLISLASTSSLFFILMLIFLKPVSAWLGYPAHTDYVWMVALIIAIDAFTALPFAYLRYQKRPIRFAALKLFSNIFEYRIESVFFLLCPWIYKTNPTLISWFFDPDLMVGYILVSNLISSGAVLLMLIPEIFKIRYRFDAVIWKRMSSLFIPVVDIGYCRYYESDI